MREFWWFSDMVGVMAPIGLLFWHPPLGIWLSGAAFTAWIYTVIYDLRKWRKERSLAHRIPSLR